MNLKELAIENKPAILRTMLVLILIGLAASLRLAPHPRNFTPLGGIALFSGAMVRDRRLAFLFPLLVMFATDAISGFNKLSALVYASFLLSVLIGRVVVGSRLGISRHSSRETPPEPSNNARKHIVPLVAAATFLGALQFFVITNFGVWAFLNSYPRTASGLVACYVAGLPLFWNTLGGDALYAGLLFGSFFLAERLAPHLGVSAVKY